MPTTRPALTRHAAATRAPRRGIALLGAALLATLAAAGCDRAPATPADVRPTAAAANAQTPATTGPLRAVVTVAPLASLVRPFLPEGAELNILMAPGRSEHGYEFSPSDIAHLGQSHVAVYVGLGLEPQVAEFLKNHASASRSVVVFADAVGIDAHDHAHHDHAPGEECNHVVDPHLWLDPGLVEKLVPAIHDAVAVAAERRGQLTDAERTRLAAARDDLLARVRAVDEEYRAALTPLKGKAIVTHHAAFPRLAERYGLTVADVIRDVSTSEPTPGQIAETVNAIRSQNVRVVFFEPQFNPRAAQRIAQAAGVRLGKLDPLGDGDWFAMMRANLQSLTTNLGE
jgi:ABC-type Zn uptake system ZnuABC Zn-binding protein ZnuA